MDITHIKAHGPWVLIRTDPPAKQTTGGLYLPDGNLVERLGYASGKVLSRGEGIPNKGKKAKEKYSPTGVEIGDRVVFRGFLKEANRPGGVLDQEHCLVHVNDILGVLEEGDLTPALPHDN